ncbi:MAG: glycosyltransferase [bacterium]
MTLSLVIPVWNDPAGLRRLLVQALALGVFSQIIVSDDNSVPEVSAAALGVSDPAILWLRSPVQRGAGHARNIALERVTGAHVIFFDSDDVFLDEFPVLVGELAGMTYDFCLFRHADSRMRLHGGLGPLDADDAAWQAAGAMADRPTPLSAEGAARLCQISAYPWNKIYRTGFLRAHGIRCTEIVVHNDLELHWMGFLKAERILTSGRVCCQHFVQDDGGRLTNRSGRERLEVFRALEAVGAALVASPRMRDYLEPFAAFYMRLFDWIGQAVEPELRASLDAMVRRFLLVQLSEPVFTLIVLRNPWVGVRINRALGGGG